MNPDLRLRNNLSGELLTMGFSCGTSLRTELFHTYGWKGMKCCLSSSSTFPFIMSVTSITGERKGQRGLLGFSATTIKSQKTKEEQQTVFHHEPYSIGRLFSYGSLLFCNAWQIKSSKHAGPGGQGPLTQSHWTVSFACSPGGHPRDLLSNTNFCMKEIFCISGHRNRGECDE